MVDLTDTVGAPETVPTERLRDRFLSLTARYTLGIVRAANWCLRLGPVPILEFGEPRSASDGVTWPIAGGLLAAEPGGELALSWRESRLSSSVRGYRPRLPRPLYDLTQRPFHHEITRLVLLQLRGRDPLPGPTPDRRSRLLACAFDVALCAAVAGRRRQALPTVYAAYHLAAWSLAGRTVGGALFGLRLKSVDGTRVTPGQALVRLVAGDRAAGTAVVRE